MERIDTTRLNLSLALDQIQPTEYGDIISQLVDYNNAAQIPNYETEDVYQRYILPYLPAESRDDPKRRSDYFLYLLTHIFKQPDFMLDDVGIYLIEAILPAELVSDVLNSPALAKIAQFFTDIAYTVITDLDPQHASLHLAQLAVANQTSLPMPIRGKMREQITTAERAEVAAYVLKCRTMPVPLYEHSFDYLLLSGTPAMGKATYTSDEGLKVIEEHYLKAKRFLTAMPQQDWGGTAGVVSAAEIVEWEKRLEEALVGAFIAAFKRRAPSPVDAELIAVNAGYYDIFENAGSDELVRFVCSHVTAESQRFLMEHTPGFKAWALDVALDFDAVDTQFVDAGNVLDAHKPNLNKLNKLKDDLAAILAKSPVDIDKSKKLRLNLEQVLDSFSNQNIGLSAAEELKLHLNGVQIPNLPPGKIWYTEEIAWQQRQLMEFQNLTQDTTQIFEPVNLTALEAKIHAAQLRLDAIKSEWDIIQTMNTDLTNFTQEITDDEAEIKSRFKREFLWVRDYVYAPDKALVTQFTGKGIPSKLLLRLWGKPANLRPAGISYLLYVMEASRLADGTVNLFQLNRIIWDNFNVPNTPDAARTVLHLILEVIFRDASDVSDFQAELLNEIVDQGALAANADPTLQRTLGDTPDIPIRGLTFVEQRNDANGKALRGIDYDLYRDLGVAVQLYRDESTKPSKSTKGVWLGLNENDPNLTFDAVKSAYKLALENLRKLRSTEILVDVAPADVQHWENEIKKDHYDILTALIARQIVVGQDKLDFGAIAYDYPPLQTATIPELTRLTEILDTYLPMPDELKLYYLDLAPNLIVGVRQRVDDYSAQAQTIKHNVDNYLSGWETERLQLNQAGIKLRLMIAQIPMDKYAVDSFYADIEKLEKSFQQNLAVDVKLFHAQESDLRIQLSHAEDLIAAWGNPTQLDQDLAAVEGLVNAGLVIVLARIKICEATYRLISELEAEHSRVLDISDQQDQRLKQNYSILQSLHNASSQRVTADRAREIFHNHPQLNEIGIRGIIMNMLFMTGNLADNIRLELGLEGDSVQEAIDAMWGIINGYYPDADLRNLSDTHAQILNADLDMSAPIDNNLRFNVEVEAPPQNEPVIDLVSPAAPPNTPPINPVPPITPPPETPKPEDFSVGISEQLTADEQLALLLRFPRFIFERNFTLEADLEAAIKSGVNVVRSTLLGYKIDLALFKTSDQGKFHSALGVDGYNLNVESIYFLPAEEGFDENNVHFILDQGANVQVHGTQLEMGQPRTSDRKVRLFIPAGADIHTDENGRIYIIHQGASANLINVQLPPLRVSVEDIAIWEDGNITVTSALANGVELPVETLFKHNPDLQNIDELLFTRMFTEADDTATFVLISPIEVDGIEYSNLQIRNGELWLYTNAKTELRIYPFTSIPVVEPPTAAELAEQAKIAEQIELLHQAPPLLTQILSQHGIVQIEAAIKKGDAQLFTSGELTYLLFAEVGIPQVTFHHASLTGIDTIQWPTDEQVAERVPDPIILSLSDNSDVVWDDLELRATGYDLVAISKETVDIHALATSDITKGEIAFPFGKILSSKIELGTDGYPKHDQNSAREIQLDNELNEALQKMSIISTSTENNLPFVRGTLSIRESKGDYSYRITLSSPLRLEKETYSEIQIVKDKITLIGQRTSLPVDLSAQLAELAERRKLLQEIEGKVMFEPEISASDLLAATDLTSSYTRQGRGSIRLDRIEPTPQIVKVGGREFSNCVRIEMLETGQVVLMFKPETDIAWNSMDIWSVGDVELNIDTGIISQILSGAGMKLREEFMDVQTRMVGFEGADKISWIDNKSSTILIQNDDVLTALGINLPDNSELPVESMTMEKDSQHEVTTVVLQQGSEINYQGQLYTTIVVRNNVFTLRSSLGEVQIVPHIETVTPASAKIEVPANIRLELEAAKAEAQYISAYLKLTPLGGKTYIYRAANRDAIFDESKNVLTASDSEVNQLVIRKATQRGYKLADLDSFGGLIPGASDRPTSYVMAIPLDGPDIENTPQLSALTYNPADPQVLVRVRINEPTNKAKDQSRGVYDYIHIVLPTSQWHKIDPLMQHQNQNQAYDTFDTFVRVMLGEKNFSEVATDNTLTYLPTRNLEVIELGAETTDLPESEPYTAASAQPVDLPATAVPEQVVVNTVVPEAPINKIPENRIFQILGSLNQGYEIFPPVNQADLNAMEVLSADGDKLLLKVSPPVRSIRVSGILYMDVATLELDDKNLISKAMFEKPSTIELNDLYVKNASEMAFRNGRTIAEVLSPERDFLEIQHGNQVINGVQIISRRAVKNSPFAERYGEPYVFSNRPDTTVFSVRTKEIIPEFDIGSFLYPDAGNVSEILITTDFSNWRINFKAAYSVPKDIASAYGIDEPLTAIQGTAKMITIIKRASDGHVRWTERLRPRIRDWDIPATYFDPDEVYADVDEYIKLLEDRKKKGLKVIHQDWAKAHAKDLMYKARLGSDYVLGSKLWWLVARTLFNREKVKLTPEEIGQLAHVLIASRPKTNIPQGYVEAYQMIDDIQAEAVRQTSEKFRQDSANQSRQAGGTRWWDAFFGGSVFGGVGPAPAAKLDLSSIYPGSGNWFAVANELRSMQQKNLRDVALEEEYARALLGVAKDANREAVKKAFRKLAREFHPDTSNKDNTEDIFKELNEAYEYLNKMFDSQ